MGNANDVVLEVLKMVPHGSILHLEYEPADGVRPEVAAAAKVLGADPRTYIVEFLGTNLNGKGEPLIFTRCLNRGNERRTFAPMRGKLTKIEILRLGPKA